MRHVERKNQRLQERMLALQREMVQLDSSIDALSKAVESPEREEALRRLRQLRGASGEGTVATRSERPMAVRSHSVIHEDLSEQAASITEEGPYDEERENPDVDMIVPKTGQDKRFANYFVTGGLHSVRPLRQEKRVQRNKAIMMLIIAVLLLYGVINLLF